MRIHESETFPVPVERVWEIVNDHGRRLEWDVMLRGLTLHTPGPTRVGTEVTQRAKWTSGGATMRARYTSVEPPGSRGDGSAEMAIEMVEGPWYFGRFTATNRMRPAAGGGCVSEGEYDFTIRPRWLAWLVGPVVRAVFRRETRRRWAAWRRYAADTKNAPPA